MAIRLIRIDMMLVLTNLVCSLEKPQEAEDLSDAEKAAIEYGELFE